MTKLLFLFVLFNFSSPNLLKMVQEKKTQGKETKKTFSPGRQFTKLQASTCATQCESSQSGSESNNSHSKASAVPFSKQTTNVASEAFYSTVASSQYVNISTCTKGIKNAEEAKEGQTAVSTKKKTDLCVPSDAPTALVAPSDYQNLFSKAKKPFIGGGARKPDLTVPSDAPTVLIAPPDYQHLFSKAKKTIGKKETNRLQTVPSDAPTALVAPSDYQNLFSRGQGQKTTSKVKGPPLAGFNDLAVKSDTPTILVAPDDYENYLDKRAIQRAAQGLKQKKTQPKRIPSDAPTVLVAHIKQEELQLKRRQQDKDKDTTTTDEQTDTDKHTADERTEPTRRPKKNWCCCL